MIKAAALTRYCSMNGIDWPSPAANFASVESEIKAMEINPDNGYKHRIN